jgi:hypothetical protein
MLEAELSQVKTSENLRQPRQNGGRSATKSTSASGNRERRFVGQRQRWATLSRCPGGVARASHQTDWLSGETPVKGASARKRAGWRRGRHSR